MENASKALLIAGGVLIAILLLTIFAYLFAHMAEGTSAMYAKLEESEINEFNQKFLNYEGRGTNKIGKDEDGNDIFDTLSIQDVVTIINLAQDNNKSSKRPITIKVWVNTNDWTDENINDILENQNNQKKKFKCTQVSIDQTTLLVNNVFISEITP